MQMGQAKTRVPTIENAAIGQLERSPDGGSLAFSARDSGKPHIFLIVCESGGASSGKPRQFTSGQFSESAPAWSSDGKFLYFTSDREGRDEIWRQTVTGEPPVQVTRNGGYTAHESADGQWLHFSQWSGEKIWRIPVSRSPQRDGDVARELVIVPPYRVRPASWAWTSDEIFFVDRGARPRSAVIRAYRLTTGKARTILGQILTDRSEVELSVLT